MVSVEDKEWLLQVFPKFKNTVLRGVNLEAYTKAETIITGRATTPDCSCSYGSYQQKINKLYDKWQEQNM